MPGDEPQTDVAFVTILIDAAMETTPTATEAGLLICPDAQGMQIELLSVSFRANVLPIDAADAVAFDLEFIDDSAADAVTVLQAAYDMLVANNTVLVGNEVWTGHQIMDPGDVINVEFDVTTPTTASEGACLVAMYRVLKRSAG